MKIDVFEQIGKAYQRSLDNKKAVIDKKINLNTVTDKMTSEMMSITIRDWTDNLLVFDGVILDVDDIRSLNESDKSILIDMLNEYWHRMNLRDSCEFISSNTMVLQRIVEKEYHIPFYLLEKETDWMEFLNNEVKEQKLRICGFITYKYDKYKSE